MKKNKVFLIILLGMILWDWSLHLVELFNAVDYHPLYPWFSSWHQYNIFWTAYWGIAIVLIILFLITEKYKDKGLTWIR